VRSVLATQPEVAASRPSVLQERVQFLACALGISSARLRRWELPPLHTQICVPAADGSSHRGRGEIALLHGFLLLLRHRLLAAASDTLRRSPHTRGAHNFVRVQPLCPSSPPRSLVLEKPALLSDLSVRELRRWVMMCVWWVCMWCVSGGGCVGRAGGTGTHGRQAAPTSAALGPVGASWQPATSHISAAWGRSPLLSHAVCPPLSPAPIPCSMAGL
jgi:hypothetical protein